MNIDHIIKAGAIVSSAGTGLLVIFIVILLAFPVLKNCENEGGCRFTSTAPEPLKAVIQPLFLASSLLIIAAGVGMIRAGTYYKYKHSLKKDKSNL